MCIHFKMRFWIHIRFWMFQCKQEVKTYLNNYVLYQKCACVNKALIIVYNNCSKQPLIVATYMDSYYSLNGSTKVVTMHTY